MKIRQPFDHALRVVADVRTMAERKLRWRISSLFDTIRSVPTPLPLVQCCAPLAEPALSEAGAEELDLRQPRIRDLLAVPAPALA